MSPWARGASIAVLLLAWAVRVYRLDTQPVWLDEAFSVWMASHPLPDIVSWVRALDQHPPGYYLLLHGWMRVFGESPWAIRSLSLWGGMLAVALGMAVARRVAGTRLMLLSGVVLAFSPFGVRYAQEARMYAWVLAAVGLSLWGAIRMWQRPGDFQGVLAFALGAAWAAWFHNVALLYPAAVFPILWWAGPRTHRRTVLWAGGFFLLLWGPWLPSLVVQAQGVAQRFWVPPLSPRSVAAAMVAFCCPFFPGPELAGVFALAWGGAIAWGGWAAMRRARTRARGAGLLVAVVVLPPTVVLLVSLVRPILVPRVLIWVLLPAWVLFAYGMLHIPTRFRWALLGGLLLVDLLSLQGYFFRYQKEAWDQVAAYVANHARPQDLILFEAGWVQLPFDYYFRTFHVPLEEHGLPVDPFVTRELEPPMRVEDLPRLYTLLAGRDRVWVVLSHVPFTDPQGLVEAAVRSRFQCREHRFVGVRLLECRSPPERCRAFGADEFSEMNSAVGMGGRTPHAKGCSW